MVKDLIISVIDFFYPPFRRIMPLQTFRYAACGGFNALLGFLVFAGSFQYMYSDTPEVHLGKLAFKSHNVSLFYSFCVSFVVGFTLNKYIVFTQSNLRGRIQLFRYFLSFFINAMISYFLLKILVEYAHIYPVLAQVITTAIVVVIGYLSQHHFTFKVKKEG